MVATVLNISEIVSDPKIRGGRSVVAGTGICVSDIALAHVTGDHLPVEVLAQNYRLSLGQVYAALAYYHLHAPDIDAEMQTNAAEAEKWIAELERQGKLTQLDRIPILSR